MATEEQSRSTTLDASIGARMRARRRQLGLGDASRLVQLLPVLLLVRNRLGRVDVPVQLFEPRLRIRRSLLCRRQVAVRSIA